MAIEFYMKADGPSEVRLMAALDVILAEVADLKTETANERAEVKAALDGLVAKIDSLEAQLLSAEAVPVGVIVQALRDAKADVKAIYTPEPADPPTEEIPPVPAPAPEPSPNPSPFE